MVVKGRAVDNNQSMKRLRSPSDMEVDKDGMAKAGEHATGTRPGPSVQPDVANSSGVAGPGSSSPPHNRGRGRTRRPTKRAKLAATVTTDDENDPTEPVTKRSRPTVRDIDTPLTGYAWVADDERCRRCKKRNLRCAINPGRACWQCACTKYACSATVTVPAQFRARSQAKSTPARHVTSSPARAPTRSPSRIATPCPSTGRRSQSRHRTPSMDSSGQQRMSIAYFFCFT